MPEQARRRMMWRACATYQSVIARMSVDWRVIDPEGWDELCTRGRGFAHHQAVEQRGGLVTDPFPIEVDAGEGRVREVAELHIVVGADDGDFLRDRQSGAPAGVEGTQAVDVIAGDEAQRPGQAADPLGQGVLLRLPILGQAARISSAMAGRALHALDHLPHASPA